MRASLRLFLIAVTLSLVWVPPLGASGTLAPVLWTPPDDVAERDLLRGPGGEATAPHGPMQFVDGERAGTAPKMRLRDSTGQIWFAKLGSEAKSETAASRLLWAVGYAADPGYFVAEIPVTGLLPDDGTNGLLRGAHLERARDPAHALGTWRWSENPFVGTRPFDGLRVMMALVNNWDLKDENNAIYEAAGPQGPVAVYEVADLGASFGTDGYAWPESTAKGNVTAYRNSSFIRSVTPETVDFATPASPAIGYVLDLPRFVHRMRMRAIGRGIPRASARWIGEWLARLSTAQLHDAFAAAGFAPEETDGYVAVLRARIERLTAL